MLRQLVSAFAPADTERPVAAASPDVAAAGTHRHDGKSAAVLHRLGAASLVIALLHRLLRRDVFYVHAAGIVRHPAIRDVLAALGVRRFDFMRLNEVAPALKIEIRAALAECIAATITDGTLETVLPLFRQGCASPERITVRKVRICLLHELQNALSPIVDVEECAHYLKRDYASVIAFVNGGPACRLLARQNAISFRRDSFCFLLAGITMGRLGIRLMRAILRLGTARTRAVGRSVTEHGERPPPGPCVVYFPHQGPMYGRLFRKDFLYEQDASSPLHPSRVLHVEIHPPAADVEQAYAEAGLQWRVLSCGGSALASARSFLTHLLKNRAVGRLTSSGGLVAIGILMPMYRRYRAYQRGIDFPQGSVAVVGYELLFPRLLSLVLQGQGLTMVAAQERLQAAYFKSFTLILDHYLVAGESVVGHLSRHPNSAVDQFHCVGLTRSDFFADYPPDRADRRKVLVLDYASPANWWENVDSLVNRAANKQFYLDIIRLAIQRPLVDFVIRGKSADWLLDPFFHDIKGVIGCLPNLSVDRDYSELNRSYRLAAAADCVIAKHTSLGDECLSVGKSVIFHDWSPNSRGYASSIYDYDGLPAFALDYEMLREKLDGVLGRQEPGLPSGWDERTKQIFGSRSRDSRVQDAVREIVKRQVAAK